MGLKAEQTAATLASLIALRTWSLGVVVYLCVFVSRRLLASMCAEALASHGGLLKVHLDEKNQGQVQRH